jgi:hypothetical protein
MKDGAAAPPEIPHLEIRRDAMGNSRNTRAIQQSNVLALIAGIQKHLGTTSITVDSTTYTSANVVTMLEGRVTASNALVAATAAFHAAVQANQDPVLTAFILKLTQAIRIMYASSPAVLADFGIAPPKTRVVTPETKVLAAAKAKATRKARNTMGSVQKKNVKGTVTSVTVTPDGDSSAAPSAPVAAQGGTPSASLSNGSSVTSAPAVTASGH